MHQDFLQQAVDLAARNAAAGGGPFAALIVKERRIIATGVNRVTADHDPTAHAEVTAIRSACQSLRHFQLSDCILYSSCEPCPMCLGAVYWARLSAVYYACDHIQAAAAGFDDSFIYDEIPKPPAARAIPMYFTKLEHADKPFLVWNQSENKIRY
ncbi:MAG: nucleoside deaminase [Methylomonas sp.]|jgi:guanine deaminase